MTTVISRLYPNKKAAGAVVAALQSAGFPNNTLEIISSKVEDLPNRLASARLPKTAAATYADELTGDMSLMVVRAPFTPFGAARKAIEIVDSFEALPSAVTNNNVLVQDQLSDDLSLSILRDHPRFLTSDAGNKA